MFRRTAPPVAALAALILTLTACTGDDGNGTTSDGDGTAPVRVATLRSITSLDPHGDLGGDLGTQLAAKAIFDRLVNSDGDEYGPELATEWTSSPDAKEWVFTLRDDVTFSDGTPLTAEDVVASVQRIQRLEGPPAGNVADLTVTAQDEHTVVFTHPAGDPALLGKLAEIWITPSELVDQDGFFSEPVGSGPYLVEEFTPEEELVLTPNPDHWDGAPTPERLELVFIPETAARMTALQTGEVQMTWGVPDDQVEALRAEDGLSIESVESNATYTMWFNSSRPAFADAAVRRALWQAVDFEGIIASLHPETGVLADSVVAPVVLGYAPQEPVEPDPEAARAALDAAGFDFDVQLELQYRGEEFRQFAQAVASDLRDVGVQVEPREKEAAVFLEDLLALNWDINLQALSVPTLDAASNLGRLYPCAAERTGYCNPELDQILAEAGSTADVAQREELYAQAAEIIWTDAVGMYPMFTRIVYAWQDGLTGVDQNASSIPDFDEIALG